ASCSGHLRGAELRGVRRARRRAPCGGMAVARTERAPHGMSGRRGGPRGGGTRHPRGGRTTDSLRVRAAVTGPADGCICTRRSWAGATAEVCPHAGGRWIMPTLPLAAGFAVVFALLFIVSFKLDGIPHAVCSLAKKEHDADAPKALDAMKEEV